MGSNRSEFIGTVTIASLAIILSLSGCGPQPGAESTAAESTATVTSAAAMEPTVPASVDPSPSATATSGGQSPEVPATPAESVQQALKSFVFPDGHISFSYPASWSVRTQRGPGRDGPPWQPVEAIVSDGTGDDLFRVASGADGIGCAAGPTKRAVLDQATVPGMREADGTIPVFGFAVENSGREDSYRMMLGRSSDVEEGDVGSACGLLVMGNGGALAGVIFNQPAFPSREAAKAWMATEQYAQLKALIMSLSYS
jgi:hypothetical protein